MATIYYLVPDLYQRDLSVKNTIKALLKGSFLKHVKAKWFPTHKPVGGIKVIYQHCILLKELGYEVYPLIIGRYEGNFFGFNIELKYLKDVGYKLLPDDVVVCPEFNPYLGLRFICGSRVLLNQSQSWLYLDQRLDLQDKGKNYIQLGYDHIMNCSQHLAELMKQHMNVDSFSVINGIDSTIFKPKQEMRVAQRVLAFSRKHPLLIDEIRMECKRLKLNYDFRVVDGLAEEQVIAEYQQADIFLATGFPEGFGLPPLEAMSCGCVVIGFTGGGASEFMVHNETALVADDGDCKAVVNHLKFLESEHNGFKETIRKNGINMASKYQLDNTKELLHQFYQNIV